MSAASTQRDQYICVFRIGGSSLCIAIEQVQQVVDRLDLLPVPLAPPVVKGLINLRGTVLTALDGGLIFGLERNPEQETHLVVIAGGQPLSLMVDDVIEVITYPRETLAPLPPNLDPRMRNLVNGVIYWKEELILFVDVDHLSDCIPREAA